jgi:hypothetical protein
LNFARITASPHLDVVERPIAAIIKKHFGGFIVADAPYATSSLKKLISAAPSMPSAARNKEGQMHGGDP